MKSILRWTFLAVSIAAPIVHQPTEDTMRLDMENEIRDNYKAAGYPDNAITEYIDILDFEHRNTENPEDKSVRLNQWVVKWNSWKIATKQLKALKEGGYPDIAIEEHLAIMQDDVSSKEKSKRMNEWHLKWEPVLMQNKQRKSMKEAGYPVSAIEEYLALMDHGECTENNAARLEQWSKKWSVVMQENALRKNLKDAGFPSAAIEAYLVAMDLGHPDAPIDEKAARMAEWQQHWGPVIEQHQMRSTLRESGYSEQAIQQFIMLKLGNSTDADKHARTAKWERQYSPGHGARVEEPSARSKHDERSRMIILKAADVLENNHRASAGQLMRSMASDGTFTEARMMDIMAVLYRLPESEQRAILEVMQHAALEVDGLSK